LLELRREGKEKINGKVKAISTFILLFTVTAMKDLLIPLIILISLVPLIVKFKISFKKLVYPVYIAIVVFLIVLFTYPGGVLWKWWILRVTENGVYYSTLILIKVLTCVSLLLILAASTRMVDIVSALSFLPDEVSEIAFLMIRYIETLYRTSCKLKMAAKSKNAFSKELSFKKRIHNLGILAGVLISRAMDKAERIYLSMVARGYSGKLRVENGWKRKEILQVILFFFFCIFLVYIDRRVVV